MREKILISNYDGEELLELAEELLGHIEEDDSYAYEDALDSLYYEHVDEIESASELESWWRENGWTLDRGYGGPNYKERVADATNWDLVWEVLIELGEEDAMLGEILYSRVKINDTVIFFDEFDEEESEEEFDEEEFEELSLEEELDFED